MKNRAELDEMDIARDWMIRQDERRPRVPERVLWLRFLGLTVLGLALIALSGCSVLADKRTVAACQVADGVSTKVAMDRGAQEKNPLLEGMEGNQILALKVAIGAFLYWIMPEVKDMSKTEKAVYATVSVIGCGAAINNAGVAARAK